VEKSLALARQASTLPMRMLDIGCGDGHTLDLYKQQPGVETHGVDFNQSALALARNNGHSVYQGRFEDVELPTDYFDLVTATHVIEHVPDPMQFAKKAFAVLKPGGIFWLETPNIESLDARMFRQGNWGGYHFPRHWFFFSRKTMLQLSNQIGFQTELVDFVPNAIFWFWTMHSIFLQNYPQARKFADTIFPPIDFQRDSFSNFLRICFFCSIDVAIKATTGETANMIVAVRKPGLAAKLP
jgi:ubiquinone/menaquinone biosynthesis C-methylase UbiE